MKLQFIQYVFFFTITLILSCTQQEKAIPIQDSLATEISFVQEDSLIVLADSSSGVFNDTIVVKQDSTWIQLGYQETYDQLPILEFDSISAKVFLQYKKRSTYKLNLDSAKVHWKDSCFTIQTSKEKITQRFQFNDDRYIHDRDFYWSDYKGYIEPLDLYVLESWNNGEFTLGYSIFIDSISNLKYELVSHADNPFEPPVPSPNNKFLATYVTNIVGDDYCFIGILKISRNKNINNYQEFSSAELQGLRVEELVWIDDRSFAIKIVTLEPKGETREWVKHFSYAKTTLSSKIKRKEQE